MTTKKVSIVMAYYNRKLQLINTLRTIKKSAYKNIEIIIVDDNSDPNQQVCSFIEEVKDDLDIKVITITTQQKTWINPCIPYNMGFEEATGDIVIIQSPEVAHIGDCIKYVVENLKAGDWLSFNCYGSPSFHFNNKIKDEKLIYGLIKENSIDNIKCSCGWCYRCIRPVVSSQDAVEVGGVFLNHFNDHFVAYHYCAAIHKSDLFNKMSGGFDESFKNSVGGDDDEFIKRLIYNKFNFKINEFKESEPFVIHQFHEKPPQFLDADYKKTKKIFKDACMEIDFEPQNDIVLAPKNEIPMSRRILIT